MCKISYYLTWEISLGKSTKIRRMFLTMLVGQMKTHLKGEADGFQDKPGKHPCKWIWKVDFAFIFVTGYIFTWDNKFLPDSVCLEICHYWLLATNLITKSQGTHSDKGLLFLSPSFTAFFNISLFVVCYFTRDRYKHFCLHCVALFISQERKM